MNNIIHSKKKHKNKKWWENNIDIMMN
jgi:hypothetical protein